MKQSIRQRSIELGFDACRFTTAAPPGSAPQFQQWLAEGKQGEMGYLQRNAHKRVEPQEILSGIKTVVCLAVAYPSEVERSKLKVESAGVVARYARFADYHDVLGIKLKELSAFVNEVGGAGTKSLWYVDTGPILERDLAQRAGIGFIG